MKFKNDIEAQAGIKDTTGNLGSAGELLSSTGTGVEWIAQSAISASSDFMFYEVKNSSGTTINKGKAVMAVGTDGNSGHILIDEMVADGSVESRYFMGVLETTVANGDLARVIAFGELDQFNTLGQNGETWADGQVLWCSPVYPGDFTITEPQGPNLKIPAAFIMKAATNGKIQIRVQGNEGIKDLYDTKITTQTDGELLVWDNTTGVWMNDDTAIIDYTNGRVGIGTTSPGTKLHIVQPGGSSQLTLERTGGGAGKAVLAGAAEGLIVYDDLYGAKMYVGTSGTYNGNVGIGTTSPGAKLDIHSATNSNALLIREDTDDSITHNFYIDSSDNAQTVLYANGQSAKISLNTAGSSYFNGGNVGIGTNSPGAKLQIGSATFAPNGNLSNNLLQIKSSTGFAYLTIGNGDVANSTSYIGGASGLTTFGSVTDAGATTERMRIDAIGNVGIGTTSPASSAKLTVMGNQTFGLPGNGSNTNGRFISIEGNTDAYGEGSGRIFFTEHNSTTAGMDGYGMSLGYRGGSTSIVGASGNTWTGLTQIGNGEWGMFGHDNNATGVKIMQGSRSATYTAFYSSGSETMRVTGGNVGIGTTSPGERLTVNSNGSTNSVLKINALDNRGASRYALQIDDNDANSRGSLYIDTLTGPSIITTGNVGIGTTTPSTNLHVVGNARVTGIYYDSGNNEGSAGQILSSTATGTSWISGSAIPGVPDGSGTANYLARWIDTDTLGIGVTYDNGTNVGIGTTSPDKKLEVYTANGTESSIRIRQASQNYWDLKSPASNTSFTISDVGGERMRITSTGNVGIGTTSPSQKLHVEGGAINVTGGVSNAKNIQLYVNDSWGYLTTTAPKFYLDKELMVDTGLIGSYNEDLQLRTSGTTRVTVNNSTGNVGIGTTSPSTKLNVFTTSNSDQELLRLTVAPADASGAKPKAILGFYTPAETNTANYTSGRITSKFDAPGYANTRVTIESLDSVGNFLETLTAKNGNVGIGTTSPAARLDVVGDGDAVQIRRSNGYASIKASSDNGGNLVLDSFSTAGAVFINHYVNRPVYIATGGGNVGIGTTSPSENLSVTGNTILGFAGNRPVKYDSGGGNFRITPDSGGWASGYFFNQTDGTYRGGFGGFGNNNTLDYFWIGDDYNDTTMVIQPSAGNVGIGTTSPSEKLEVVGNIEMGTDPTLYWNSNTLSLETKSNSIPVIAIKGSTSYFPRLDMYNAGNTTVVNRLQTSGNSYINGGNVGIGTTSPGARLDIQDVPASGTGTILNVGFNATNPTRAKIHTESYSGAFSIYDSGNNEDVKLATNGNSWLNGGNFGIGTTSPVAKLELSGASGQLLVLDDSSATGNPFMSFYQAGTRRSYVQHLDASDLLTLASEYGGIKFMTGTGGTEVDRMIINSTGNVGINTTAPTEKLAVTGNIETTEAADSVKIGFNVGDSFTLNGANTAHYGLTCGTSTSVPLVLSGYWGVAIATNGLERVRILQSNGYVGILTTTPAYELDVTGTIRATGNVIAFSDARVKENIKTIDSALEKVNKLRGVEFNKIGEDKTCIGVIAQEVEEVLPEVVETDDNGMKAVAYGNMVGLLIEAMKEQQKQIDELKAKLESYGS